MSDLDRRALLGSLGVASASTLLWALGCGGARPTTRPIEETRAEVRSWLREATERLAASYPSVHVLAVRRQRTTAALDVLGAGVARVRRDGLVLTVRDARGHAREQVTSDLSDRGLDDAVRALVGNRKSRRPLGATEPQRFRGPRVVDDRALTARLERLSTKDRALNSRIVYSASSIDVDDAVVWSLGLDHEREQRLVRVVKRITRAAWNGSRPVVSEVIRGWTGGVDDQDLDEATIEHATRMALLLVTPGAFTEQLYPVVLDPSVTALLLDAAARALLANTGPAPEVTRRLAARAPIASPLVSLVDDPTTTGAYGGYAFADDGTLATRLPLVDRGQLVNVLARGARPGHTGPSEPGPSHLRLTRGDGPLESLYGSGLLLEAALDVVVDPASGRVVLGAARARELAAGKLTGRVWADVELVGEVAALLGGIDGIASDGRITPIREERDGGPRWRSIDAPSVRTRGVVRARRRRA